MFPLLHFSEYKLGFHLKTLISKSPRDETLTLVFKMLQQAQETLATPRERERERERVHKKIQEREEKWCAPPSHISNTRVIRMSEGLSPSSIYMRGEANNTYVV
jgi:hypothetical protein